MSPFPNYSLPQAYRQVHVQLHIPFLLYFFFQFSVPSLQIPANLPPLRMTKESVSRGEADSVQRESKIPSRSPASSCFCTFPDARIVWREPVHRSYARQRPKIAEDPATEAIRGLSPLAVTSMRITRFGNSRRLDKVN